MTDEGDDAEYVIDRVARHRRTTKRMQYCVRWYYYDTTEEIYAPAEWLPRPVFNR